jgi:CubicO group peptidase (beta-lactamase class C family)/pimeloyl-ACP methyl ester carboxylesterase
MTVIPYANIRKRSVPTRHPIIHTLMLALVWILEGILLIVLLLPVLLLFVATAVPFYWSITLLVVDVGLILWLVRRGQTVRTVAAVLVGFIAVAALAVIASQGFAATPSITDPSGKPLPNSIAVMEKVELGGSEQWITIRGKDINKPVLLYLGIGGPGAGGFPASAMTLTPLEDHFVVVNWDQPGTGKSYHAVPISTLTVDRFVSDAHELTQLLRARFHQEKIFVMGLSWGTILGTMLVQQYPDLFYAYVGTGQMVNTTENDRLGYEIAMRVAAEQGETATVNRLRRNGPPPYSEDGMAMKYALYNNVLFRYMGSATLEMVLLLAPQFAKEYGLIDRVNFDRGLIESFAVIYPQLQSLDFTTQAAKVDVPMYFIVGREDVNAMASLVERYYSVLQAPYKELIWVEGGHGANPDQLLDAMVNHVLPQSYPQAQPVASPVNGPSDVHEVEAFLDGIMNSQLDENHIAGAAVAVVKDGELLFAKGYGYTDFEAEEAVAAEQTLMRTDSTGKLFVWTAVMQLAEEGKLDLDADVNTYLDFKIPETFAEGITLKHLMSHSAGFEDQGYLFTLDSSEVEPVGIWLARNIPARVHPPGEVSAYSNYGTALAGYIVERISGMPFEQYVEEHIFKPLGMARSTFRQPVPAALAADVSTNYRYDNIEYRQVPLVYLRVPAMGEGHTTVTDMARFMMAHLAASDSPILQAATLRQMHSQLFAHDPRVSGIAYGFVQTTQNGQQILRHEGNNPGVSSSALFLIPEEQLGVYVAYNSNGGFGPGEQFRQLFLNHYYPALAAPPQVVRLTTEQSKQLIGSYRSTRMFYTSFAKVVTLLGGNYADVTVSADTDGSFTTQGIGPTPLQWVPVEPDMLRLADGAVDSHGDLVFDAAEQTGEQNRLMRLYVGNNPYRAYEKIHWYESVDFQIFILILCELVFLLVLLAIPLRRLIGKPMNLESRMVGSATPKLAQWLLATACLLGLLFPLGLLLTLENALLYGVTSALIGVLALPLLAIACGIGALVVWRNWRVTGWADKLHYGAVLVAMAVFVGWLNYWNLLGFHF